jgi:hypothetical protein
MALRAAERGKLPATRDGLAKSSSSGRATLAARSIPVTLAPLLQPYRKEGRLSIRVERMHQLARLSRGRNNGDGSWSLASDELDDLEYRSPEGIVDAQSLSIRIIGLDQDGTTLAILEVPILFGEKQPSATPEGTAPAVAGDQDVLVQRQRDELKSLKSLLGERDAELAKRADFEVSRDTLASELSAARASWESEMHRQLADAAARARTNLEQARTSWKAEQAAHIAAAEKRAEQRIAEAEERSRRELKDALAHAETELKAAEAKRLANAETIWRDKSASAVAEATAKCERAEQALSEARSKPLVRMSLDEVENRRLRQDMGTLRAALAERETSLAQMRAAAERDRETQRREHEAAQSNAMAAWKDAEAARMSAAETQWREQSNASLNAAIARGDRAEAALAVARAQLETVAKSAGDDVESRLRGEVAALRATLTERDAAVAQARSSADQSTDMLAEISGRCERAESALTGAQTEAAAKSDLAESETNRLRAELASVHAVLADRDAAMAQTRLTAERALQRAQVESDTALSQAQASWRADEGARFAAAEAQWRKQSVTALAEATARYNEAEAALAQVRVRGGATDKRESETVAHLRNEIQVLQSALAGRDDKLPHTSPVYERRDTSASRVAIRQNQDWDSANPLAEKATTPSRLIRDVVVVAALAAAGILFWPRLQSCIPPGWLPGFAESEPATNVQAPQLAAAPAPRQHMAIVVRPANVHADPTKTAAVISTLQHGREVTIVAVRNSWTLVQVDAKDNSAKPQQGWVYSSFLKSAVNGEKTSASAKR